MARHNHDAGSRVGGSTLLLALMLGFLVMPTASGGQVGPLIQFANGTPADADEVNQNFSDLRGEINDNDTRLTTLETNRVSNSAVPLRMLRGRVAADGMIDEGAGWSVAHAPASGVYTINFVAAFGGTGPSVVATAVGGPTVNAVIFGFTGVQVVIMTTDNGVQTDLPFHFIAVGR